MKFSIRFSILSIILSLLISVSLVMVIIYNHTVNNILIETSKNSLKYASAQVGEEVAKYFLPLDQLSLVGAGLIQDNSVTPGDSLEFTNFLYNILITSHDIRKVFFADVNGGFYLVNQSDDDIHFTRQSRFYSAQGVKQVVDNYESGYQNDISTHYLGKIKHVGSRFVTNNILDLRLSSWYKLTEHNKKHTWFVYPATVISDEVPGLVVASLYPIYGSTGKLRGIFGLDIPLDRIFNFVKSIKVTPNSIVVVCDKERNVLSAYSKRVGVTKNYRMSTLSDLEMPWVEVAFDLYLKNGNPIFLFDFEGEKYIAVYKEVPRTEDKSGIIKGAYQWMVGIVTPVDDITGPLEKSVLYALFAFVAILFIGIILATAFSSRLSRSIVKLAQDAELICELKFDKIKNVVSRIKEVTLMADAFVKMKAALSSFQKYMPSALVKNLMLSGKIAEVGGNHKRLTLLFSDIENFSSIAEKMSPDDLMYYLSHYFEVATKVIINNGGTVDKYIGDGILAFWGAPIDEDNHALCCCKTALALQETFEKLNTEWRLSGKPEIKTRIGISTGEVVVGNVGSEDRLNYTVLGDQVNLASRLELLNKIYGTYIIVSEFTYNVVKEFFKFRLIDKVKVKGKNQGVYVYELLNYSYVPSEYDKLFSDAFVKYEYGNWQGALDIFRVLESQYPKDKLVKVFVDRCILFISTPPPFWDGAWVMAEK